MAKVLRSKAYGASTDLTVLAMNLRTQARDVKPAVRRAVRENAKDIRDNWKRLYKASELHFHAKHYPKSITYDMESRVGPGIGAEIGPDKNRKQGPLGNLIEFGSRNNWPQMEGGRALAIQEPLFIADMRKIARLHV